MIFRFGNKEYRGATAIEVVAQIQQDDTDFSTYAGGTTRHFIEWSLKKLSDRLPPRELDLSPRVSEEVQAQGYLSLRHDFDIGKIIK